MIFNLYSRVVVKVGDERHVYDSGRLMFSEVQEIEKVTDQSYAEWSQALGKYSITAIAALLHVLRKRDGMASDFVTMQFNAAELDVVPLHEDGTEFTPEEVAKDLAKRVEEATAGADPTLAAAAVVAPEDVPQATDGTSPSSPSGSGSAPGNGISSPGPISSRAKRTSTAS